MAGLNYLKCSRDLLLHPMKLVVSMEPYKRAGFGTGSLVSLGWLNHPKALLLFTAHRGWPVEEAP